MHITRIYYERVETIHVRMANETFGISIMSRGQTVKFRFEEN